VGVFPDLVAKKLKFGDFALQQAGERTKTTTERKDFYHYMLEAEDPDTRSKYSQQELWGEASVLIVAGTDTSATVLASTFYYLNSNPKALERARREVWEAFPSGDVEDIRSGPALSSCHYLRACLDESMRMTPPVPGIFPRLVLAGGFAMDSHNVPAGTEVSVPHYAIEHNAAYYSLSLLLPTRTLDSR
jgi:cytochrome P450